MEVKIKRIRTARHLRLRVLPKGEVVLTCHPFTPQRTIDSFLAEHESWIAEKLSLIQDRREALITQPKTLLLHGREYQFKLQVTNNVSPTVKIVGNEIVVSAGSEEHETVRKILEKWYVKTAKKYFSERVLLLCDVINHDILNVTIRSQRTRWGSCSSRKTISLNWRLILTPDWVSDYVIYHELAHLSQMNHSKKFWDLVNSYYPQYKKAEHWLTEHHDLLQF
jgi:predicted metal-dependent hydrolase